MTYWVTRQLSYIPFEGMVTSDGQGDKVSSLDNISFQKNLRSVVVVRHLLEI